MKPFITSLFMVFALFTGWMAMAKDSSTLLDHKPDGYPVFVSAGGCFWCTESEFRRLPGVLFTRVGYTGGPEVNPTYETVSAHKTGHAEAVEVTYDPKVISLKELLEFFLTRAHDPTELDRQGPDVGHQYRSALFYGSDDEKAMAQAAIDDVNARKVWPKPIVTTLEPLTTFWEAEGYHQQYFDKYERKTGAPHVNDRH